MSTIETRLARAVGEREVRRVEKGQDTERLRHVGTTVSETAIAIRLANDPDPAKATVWIDLASPAKAASAFPALSGSSSGRRASPPPLTLFQIAALRYARDVIVHQIDRLAETLLSESS